MKKSLMLLLVALSLTGCSAKQQNIPSKSTPTNKSQTTDIQKSTKPIQLEASHKDKDYANMTSDQLYEEGEKCEKQNNSIQAIECYYKASTKGSIQAKKKLEQFRVNSKEYEELKIK